MTVIWSLKVAVNQTRLRDKARAFVFLETWLTANICSFHYILVWCVERLELYIQCVLYLSARLLSNPFVTPITVSFAHFDIQKNEFETTHANV